MALPLPGFKQCVAAFNRAIGRRRPLEACLSNENSVWLLGDHIPDPPSSARWVGSQRLGNVGAGIRHDNGRPCGRDFRAQLLCEPVRGVKRELRQFIGRCNEFEPGESDSVLEFH